MYSSFAFNGSDAARARPAAQSSGPAATLVGARESAFPYASRAAAASPPRSLASPSRHHPSNSFGEDATAASSSAAAPSKSLC